MKNLIRKILKESDWGWTKGPTRITKTVREWYDDIDTLKEVIKLTDVVEISGWFSSDEYSKELQNELFIIDFRELIYRNAIYGTPIKSIYSSDGGLIVSNQSDTYLGFPEDYDLILTVTLN